MLSNISLCKKSLHTLLSLNIFLLAAPLLFVCCRSLGLSFCRDVPLICNATLLRLNGAPFLHLTDKP